jgi:hypothetical protein
MNVIKEYMEAAWQDNPLSCPCGPACWTFEATRSAKLFTPWCPIIPRPFYLEQLDLFSDYLRTLPNAPTKRANPSSTL